MTKTRTKMTRDMTRKGLLGLAALGLAAAAALPNTAAAGSCSSGGYTNNQCGCTCTAWGEGGPLNAYLFACPMASGNTGWTNVTSAGIFSPARVRTRIKCWWDENVVHKYGAWSGWVWGPTNSLSTTSCPSNYSLVSTQCALEGQCSY